jgi:hypothetical protein
MCGLPQRQPGLRRERYGAGSSRGERCGSGSSAHVNCRTRIAPHGSVPEWARPAPGGRRASQTGVIRVGSIFATSRSCGKRPISARERLQLPRTASQVPGEPSSRDKRHISARERQQPRPIRTSRAVALRNPNRRLGHPTPHTVSQAPRATRTVHTPMPGASTATNATSPRENASNRSAPNLLRPHSQQEALLLRQERER